MKFEDALKAMREGKKVRRIGCSDYLYIEDGTIKSNDEDSDDRVFTYWAILDNWEIHEEPKQKSKYFDIGEAIRRMKSCKHVSLKFWNNPNIYLSYVEEGGSQLPQIKVKTIRGYFAPWMPNHSELLSEEFYEVEGG